MLKRTSPLLFAVIAFIVGLNLRPILASVGPLFSVLQREAGLTATQFSLLTTLPVAMMGLAALCGPWLLARSAPSGNYARALHPACGLFITRF
jgi:CP family cyanate transporter-like MFS transporter